MANKLSPMESMVESHKKFWTNKKVLITGHTGFKGSWLSVFLDLLGAKVTGISIEPPSQPNLYEKIKLNDIVNDYHCDIRNGEDLDNIISKTKPDIIFHLAAQSIVRYSYDHPKDTFETNVIGSLNVLESTRKLKYKLPVIMITTDKCYDNQEWCWPYRETDALGGHDPYSSSKAAMEILVASYRDSFLANLATCRAGNVIGGGDWAKDRIIPDFFRAFQEGNEIQIRNPNSIRPWQHVLDPLYGYIVLAEKMSNYDSKYAEPWNFGPENTNDKSVEWLVKEISKMSPHSPSYFINKNHHPFESRLLKLDSSKAKEKLGWRPKWKINTVLQKTFDWYYEDLNSGDMLYFTRRQIEEFLRS